MCVAACVWDVCSSFNVTSRFTVANICHRRVPPAWDSGLAAPKLRAGCRWLTIIASGAAITLVPTSRISLSAAVTCGTSCRHCHRCKFVSPWNRNDECGSGADTADTRVVCSESFGRFSIGGTRRHFNGFAAAFSRLFGYFRIGRLASTIIRSCLSLNERNTRASLLKKKSSLPLNSFSLHLLMALAYSIYIIFSQMNVCNRCAIHSPIDHNEANSSSFWNINIYENSTTMISSVISMHSSCNKYNIINIIF